MKGRDIWIIGPVFACGIAYMVWEARDQVWPAMKIAGLIMIVIGFAGWVTGRIQLGAAFSVKAKASILVTHGLYSRIRNPIYVFGSVLIAGACLFFEKPIYLLVFVLIVPMQIARAREEARVLEGKFGEEYRRYRSAVWF